MKMKAILPVVLCSVLAAGCAATGPGSDAPVKGDPVALAGHGYMWADGVSEDCELPPSIAFDEKGAISGQAGCNRLLGQVRQDGLRVDFSNLGSTMKLCAPQFMKVERTFIDFLGRAAFVTASTAVPGGIDLWDKAGERIVTLVPEKAGKCD